MKPWTSALMKSSPHWSIETMCQRPTKGDSGLGFAFAIVLLPVVAVLSPSRCLTGNVGDESLAIRLLLDLPAQGPGVHDQAVHLDQPDYRALLDALAKHPMVV